MNIRYHVCIYFLFCFLVLVFSGVLYAQNPIEVSTPMSPPSWAFMEHALLKENVRYIEAFAEKYVNPVTGYLDCEERWGGGDGPDDAMECFYNWPLLYVLGAPKSTLDLFKFIWNGHIEQYSDLGMFYREFITSFDWEHNGEGLAAFELLPLSDPKDWRTQQRIIRFANFYTGRDTTTHNYDSVHKIIPSIQNGSKGPRMKATFYDWTGRDEYNEWWADWLKETRGDVPMNFHVTSLVANAYILTGDKHYKDWIDEYMSAWRDRTIANKGIVPSNVGVNGIVGEHWDGKWYGGLMGWNWKFGGWGILGRSVRIGFTNAFFITGDEGYLDVLRKQGDNMLNSRKKDENGRSLFPNKYGDEGWYGYGHGGPLFEGLFADLYLFSLEDEDLNRLYDASQIDRVPDRRRNERTWNFEYEAGRFQGGNEITWIDFLKGENPGYPLKALDDGYARVYWIVKGIKSDQSTPDTRRADTSHIIRISPEAPLSVIGAVTGALVNLTMGGAQPMWSGALLFCQLRYFNPVEMCPGLPGDIGALVTEITKDYVKVILVNINQTDTAEVIVQTGAYGEHQCKRVEVNGASYPVNKRFFNISLAPGAGAEFAIYRDRFVNKPTFAFPWHGDSVPAQ